MPSDAHHGVCARPARGGALSPRQRPGVRDRQGNALPAARKRGGAAARYGWKRRRGDSRVRQPAKPALEAGEELDATVVDMRFVKPVDADLAAELAGTHGLLVTVEENAVLGGAGSAVA